MDLMRIVEIFNKYNTDDMLSSAAELYDLEPHPDGHQREILRCTIMGYELGAIQQAVVRNASESLDENIKIGHIENGKLGMADLLTQCKMLCIELDWDYKEIERLGIDHLRERHEELKVDGWSEK